MLDDFRFALRSLLRAPVFTIATVATLALGIGANTAVFTVVDSLALRPLPFGDRTSRLVTLHSTHPTQATDWDDAEISWADLTDLRDSVSALEGAEGWAARNFSFATDESTERVLGASVTPGLFPLLGTAPQLGRNFRLDEGAEPGFESVAIIGHSLWERKFGADPRILGRAVPLNGREITIVGVMPPRFGFPERQEIWVPYAPSGAPNREARSLLGVALLERNVTLGAARAELAAAAAGLASRYPDTNREWGVHALPLHEFFAPDALRRSLSAMLGAVGLVLLVACANVAGLILARGIGRRRELTLRAALGAGRGRLTRLVLAESFLLAAAGGVFGLMLGKWGVTALLASSPEPPPWWASMEIDSRVVLFVVLASIVTALACGLIPALRASRVDPAADLAGARGSGEAVGESALQAGLVVGQVALSLALLFGAVLLSQSAKRLLGGDGGFDPAPLLSARLYLSGDIYDPAAAKAQAIARIVDAIAAIPGVEAAAATGAIPTDDGGAPVRLGPPRGGAAGEEIGAHAIPVTADFWRTLGVELLQGRTFSAAEAGDPQARVVIVNASLASLFWPGEDAVGRELRFDGGAAWRVVGVAPDLVYEELGEETSQSRYQIHLPYGSRGWRTMALLVRAKGDPAELATPVREAVRAFDPALATYDVLTMPQRRIFTHWTERLLGRAFSGFAAAALMLACLGAWGLAAYGAARRRHEIGIRMALGAARNDILRLLLGRGARLATLGILIGLPAAVITARILESLLFAVSPWQGGLWIALPMVLAASILAATFLPARRASLSDPAEVLRHD